MKGTDQITRTQQELADRLATRLSKLTGKTYPPDISLKTVLEDYRAARAGNLTNATRQTVGP